MLKESSQPLHESMRAIILLQSLSTSLIDHKHLEGFFSLPERGILSRNYEKSEFMQCEWELQNSVEEIFGSLHRTPASWGCNLRTSSHIFSVHPDLYYLNILTYIICTSSYMFLYLLSRCTFSTVHWNNLCPFTGHSPHYSRLGLAECHEPSLVASCSFNSMAAEMWGVKMGG